MPIFEYRCKKCNTRFEIFHKSASNLNDIVCPDCHSNEYQKLFSSFSASGFSTGNSVCESGNCNTDPSISGGCSSGMCGLN